MRRRESGEYQRKGKLFTCWYTAVRSMRESGTRRRGESTRMTQSGAWSQQRPKEEETNEPNSSGFKKLYVLK